MISEYENRCFIEALKSFDVKVFKDFLKKFQMKSYKKFKLMNYRQQKLILCQCIIDNKKIVGKDLVKKAKDYQKMLEEKLTNGDKH